MRATKQNVLQLLFEFFALGTLTRLVRVRMWLCRAVTKETLVTADKHIMTDLVFGCESVFTRKNLSELASVQTLWFILQRMVVVVMCVYVCMFVCVCWSVCACIHVHLSVRVF